MGNSRSDGADGPGSSRAVLLVLGASRSGTTIVGKLLGALPGFENLGESMHFGRRLAECAPCGCGQPLDVCSYWSPVLDRLGRDALMSGGVAPAAVYDAVERVHGCQVVVDTSKDPAFGRRVLADPSRRVVVLHLVRDPRGVLYSRHRGWRARLDATRPVPLSDLIRTGLSWQRVNATAAAVARSAPDAAFRLRYEDVATDPVAALTPVARSLGAEVALRALIRGGSAIVDTQHTVAGNPVQFETGHIRIRSDDAWLTGLRRRYRVASYLCSLPSAPLYGYRVSGRRRS